MFVTCLANLLLMAIGGALPGPPGRVSLSGYVRMAGRDQPLIGVTVSISRPPARLTLVGTLTDQAGFYSLSLPAGDSLRVTYSAVGFQSVVYPLYLRADSVSNVALEEGQTLQEVRVRAQLPTARLCESEPRSHLEIPLWQLKSIPALLGEKDVLKAIQLLPGVQKGSEGQTGFYVRGGGPDQNLITLDEATVYNPSHLFGFFSVFNGDAIQRVNVQKGGFPARYGGRLSSVIELTMKEGNPEKFHGQGGVGLLASRLTLEGPLPRAKPAGRASGSYQIGGRRTYFNELVNPLLNQIAPNRFQSRYSFYDLNGKAVYTLGPANTFYLSGYTGQDHFQDQSPNRVVSLHWGNSTGSLRWHHRWTPQLVSNLSLLFSEYRSTSAALQESPWQPGKQFSLQYGSGIRDFSLKYDLVVQATTTHGLQLGGQTTTHRFQPTAQVTDTGEGAVSPTPPDALQAMESSLYLEDSWQPTGRWRMNSGLRLSYFQQRVRYLRAEPRLSVNYTLSANWVLHGSFALTNQYIHLLSTTGVGLPTDVWVPTTPRVRPQRARQLALGLVKGFSRQGLVVTLEGYGKRMDNITSLKEGASFMPLADPAGRALGWEDKVVSGKGWSYGLELLLKKETGCLTGWVGYTLSRTQWQFADLNGGRPFFPYYDRRHDLSLVGIYKLTKQITLSGTWVYGSGNQLTLPLRRYKAYGPGGSAQPTDPSRAGQGDFQQAQWVNDYGSHRNNFQAQAYHRLDVGLQFSKKRRQFARTWELSVYNAYNQRNPFFYQLEAVSQGPNQPTRMGLFSYSVFPLLPSLSYNVSF